MATKTTAKPKKIATKKVSAKSDNAKSKKSNSLYYPLLIKLLKDDEKLKRGATKALIMNKMKEQMADKASNPTSFANAVKKAFTRGVRENDILVLSKDKVVITIADPEKMSFLGSQRYKLTPECKERLIKLEKEAAKKAKALAEGKPYPAKKTDAAPKIAKKSAGKKVAASGKNKKGKKVAKKVSARANSSVLKKAKKQKARAKVVTKKKVAKK